MKKSGARPDGPKPKKAGQPPRSTRRGRRTNSGEKSGGRELTPDRIPQPHGGALLPGGQEGNKGGTGRPPNLVRDICRLSYEKRIPILEEIADGEPVEYMAVPVFELLRHVHCPDCGSKLKVNSAEELLVKVRVKGSARPKDRVSAIKEIGDRGIGSKVEVETPSSPLVVGVTVGPEVAQERTGS